MENDLTRVGGARFAGAPQLPRPPGELVEHRTGDAARKAEKTADAALLASVPLRGAVQPPRSLSPMERQGRVPPSRKVQDCIGQVRYAGRDIEVRYAQRHSRT